jgi:hypothetical protein
LSRGATPRELLGYNKEPTSEARRTSILEQKAHELLESGHFLPIRPEGHDLLEVVELGHTPSIPFLGCSTALKGVIQRLDLSNLVTLDIL